MAASKHPNRRAINWFLYNISDRFLRKYSHLYKGVMYDLGCGERPYEDFFLKYVDKNAGVDWSGTMHNLKADVVADLNKPLPIENEVADTIISLSVMEHLCEPQTMLNEARRILKPGGAMILQVPWQWHVHEAPYDFYRYTPYGLRYMFAKAGFVDIVVEPAAGFFTTWILKFNYFTSRFVRGPQILRVLIKTALLPIWYLGQLLAPYYDKLDRHRELEAPGYYVVSKKPVGA